MALELELKKLGFSDKEARVYLALLELGSAAVQDIAAKAKVNRATTYVVLDKLSKDGIVSTVEHGKKTHFAAESPAALLRIFKTKEREMRDKEDEFKKALPEFEALYNLSGEKPIVRFFEGLEGVRAVREGILTSDEKVIRDIYSLEYSNLAKSFFSDTENEEFLEQRRNKGITIRSIYTSDSGPFTGFKTEGERKFVPKEKFPFSGDILIYGNYVVLTTLRGKLISIIIENKVVADTMRLVFELAWLGADHA